MRKNFSELIKQLHAEFDTVVIDARPVMAVTDASVIAAAIPESVAFMIAGAGMPPLSELKEAISRMSRCGQAPAGVVLIGYRQERARYAGGYGCC